MSLSQPRVETVATRVRIIQFLLLIAAGLIIFGLLTLPIGLRSTSLAVKVGDVSPRDLQAPHDAEYVSEVRTNDARDAAANAVTPVYSPPDPSIARQQIERLHTALQYITLVREDTNSTDEQKQADLAALSDVHLDSETTQQILALPSATWDSLQQEALSVLEQVMRNSIRQDSLDTVRRSIPSRVSLSFTEDQASLVADLMSAFVVPNSLYSDDLTNTARQVARDAVQPVVQTYKAGETIVPGGEIITPADMEALQELGMIRPGQRFADLLGAAAITVLSLFFVAAYFFRRRRTSVINDARSLAVITLISLVFLAGARLVVPGRTLLPYFYPIPAAGLLLSTLFGLETGMVISLALSLLAVYGLATAPELGPYFLFTSLMGLMVLGPARRFWAFLRAGGSVALAGAGIILAYHLPVYQTDPVGIVQLLGAVAFNGLASASIALTLQYMLAQTLGFTTPLQLLDVSRPDSPLLKFFLRNAPGTYQHSLQVANLAEQAAERIGADPLLTRVGAQFHDVGKANNPSFFIENQLPNSIDKHDDMAPEQVAEIIIRHVTDGVVMARKNRLPRRLIDFMLEHHGTLITRYQYNQAVEAAGGDTSKVDIAKFRYPGPRPRSRETAILMLADGVEARARAEHPDSEESLRALVRSVIDFVTKNGQLDDTQITFRDLNLILDSFVTTLRGQYHPRIEYPKTDPVPVSSEPDTAPQK
ncbi:MAG TPA: HDIG domain-containing protein [Anaerolineales bacterium]|nr:HDIG domain-containing protein [Anaerolineales bacterium]